MADVRKIDPETPTLKITERKTGKARTIALNKTALGILQQRLEDCPDDVWLFQSPSPRHHRNAPKPYSRQQSRLVFSQVGQKIRPKVALGTHSMRKTRGYAMHADGRPIEEICRALNHSNPAVTMRYIGLTQEAINQTYTDYEL